MTALDHRGRTVTVVGPYVAPVDGIPAVVLVENADGHQYPVHEHELIEVAR